MNRSPTRFSRSADVVFRRILDEHILVPVRGQLADLQRVFTLNPVGVTVWEALAVPRTADELAARVTAAFDVDAATAAADVRAFLGDLQREGLVVPADASAGPD